MANPPFVLITPYVCPDLATIPLRTDLEKAKYGDPRVGIMGVTVKTDADALLVLKIMQLPPGGSFTIPKGKVTVARRLAREAQHPSPYHPEGRLYVVWKEPTGTHLCERLM